MRKSNGVGKDNAILKDAIMHARELRACPRSDSKVFTKGVTQLSCELQKPPLWLQNAKGWWWLEDKAHQSLLS